MGTISVGGYDLSVFCNLQDLSFSIHYSIPTSLVHDELHELDTVGLTFAFDQKHDDAKPSVGMRSSFFSYPSTTSTAFVAIDGRGAMDIAKKISRAARSITVAVTTDAAVGDGPQFNKTTFTAAKSTFALSYALAACKDATFEKASTPDEGTLKVLGPALGASVADVKAFRFDENTDAEFKCSSTDPDFIGADGVTLKELNEMFSYDGHCVLVEPGNPSAYGMIAGVPVKGIIIQQTLTGSGLTVSNLSGTGNPADYEKAFATLEQVLGKPLRQDIVEGSRRARWESAERSVFMMEKSPVNDLLSISVSIPEPL